MTTTTTRPARARHAAAVAVAVLVLAGCGGDEPAADEPPAEPTSAPATTSSGEASASDAPATADAGDATAAGAAVAVAVAVADTDLGPVLVDGDGVTLYVFDNDDVDTSACTEACLDAWPPVLAGEVEAGEGVTADLGTFTREDGGVQVTANGLPLYRFASDAAAGDTQGQGVGGLWWVVDPAGAAVTEAAGEATEATYGAATY